MKFKKDRGKLTMKNENVKKLTYTALFTAIVCVLTYIIKIPTANGYLNLGDCGVYVAAVMCGPLAGAFAGGVGSALADIFGGYASWALPTFIIKGVMGLVIGYFASKTKYVCVRNIIWMVITGVWMVLGYYFADILVFGSSMGTFGAAILGMIPNAIQNLTGIVTSNLVLAALSKTQFKGLRQTVA